jgi:hypothetical protein
MNYQTELQRLVACRATHLRGSPAWYKLTMQILKLTRGK